MQEFVTELKKQFTLIIDSENNVSPIYNEYREKLSVPDSLVLDNFSILNNCITLPQDYHLYKTMDFFYDEAYSNAYNNSKSIPVWYASLSTAVRVINSRWGGLHSFRIKESQLFVINLATIEHLRQIVTHQFNPITEIRNKRMKKDYILDILTLAASRDLLLQAKLFAQYNNYGNELWVYSPKDVKVVPGDYFALVKSKGSLNYDFAYIIKYISEKYYSGKINGYIIPHKYTPYTQYRSGGEEVVLFTYRGLLTRDITDPFDWINSCPDSIRALIPNNFIPNSMAYGNDSNKDYALLKQYNSTSFPRGTFAIIDVVNYQSYNRNDKPEDNRLYLMRFLAEMNPVEFLLIRAPQEHFSGFRAKILPAGTLYTRVYEPSSVSLESISDWITIPYARGLYAKIFLASKFE